MVIDHRYKFIFVELPLTATSAISKEIREQYGCEPFLNKHATYDDFLRKASPAEKKYQAIGSVRNPLDQTVSMYFKYKNDLDQRFSSGRKRPGKWLRKSLAKNRDAVRYQFIIQNNADFETYFLKFLSGHIVIGVSSITKKWPILYASNILLKIIAKYLQQLAFL
ncbi:MAG: hypothetical protein IPO47_00275 [Bacteroidetes bacterium]|nr:hypothetical protein [Bacteroidota bacterium]